MLFNSLEFGIFLPIVFILYWFASSRNLRVQNVLVLVASYFFYGWWDWRFLFLIGFSTLIDYGVGHGLSTCKHRSKRVALLWVSIVVNIGALAFFKYFNFFLDNVAAAFTLFGAEISTRSLNVILPVGISFYTFQTLSYSIDVYRQKIEPTKDFVAFAAFVSFFPQLVAGPIERASHLLPQFHQTRVFEYQKAVNGLRQVLWGLFKKIVIADNCAVYADLIFSQPAEYSGSTLVWGVLFFSVQIYGDFSGYSDVAIGISRIFGFELKKNFAFPYFSRDVAEFWRRWHISLSTWFRDYLYIPLGGSKGGKGMKVRNTFIVFAVSGLWHGANWTFVVWGLINALCFLPVLLAGKNRDNLDVVAEGRFVAPLRDTLKIMLTFSLISFSWIFFRAENLSHALSYIGHLLDPSLLSMPSFPGLGRAAVTWVFVAVMFLVEWLGREREFALSKIESTWAPALRWILYYVISISIFLFRGREQEFIYFQF